jgi:Flp pilus assembly pilin Flp
MAKRSRECGALLIEYMLLLMLVVVVAIVCVTMLGQGVSQRFSSSAEAFQS